MTTLTFQDKTLNVIDCDGRQWLTIRDITAALYPVDKGGAQSDAPFARFERQMRNLYARHAEEFSESMTALIDVQTAGGVQKVRVFSLRGAHLLGMFARTKKAKAFRRWVLDIIERHRDEAGILTTEYHQALAALALAQETASLHGRGLNLWRQRKPSLRERVQALIARMQPDMFISAR